MNVDLTDTGKDESPASAPNGARPGNFPAVAARPPVPAEFEPSPPPVAPLMMPNALTLLVALRRRYRLVLVLGPILAGLVGAAIWFVIPPAKYTAKALLHVSSIQPKIIFNTGENRVDFGTYQKTQLTLLKSKMVLSKALDDPKVSKLEAIREQVDPVLWLEKRIQADYLGEIFRIWMTGDKPDDLAVLVNAVAEAYRTEVVQIESKERYARRDELEKLYNEYQSKLRQSRDRLKTLTQRFGTKEKQTIRFTQELAIERQATARRDLLQTQSDLLRSRAEFEIAKGQPGDKLVIATPPEQAVRQLVEEDQGVQELRQKITKAQATIDRANRIAKDPSDPSLVAPRKEMEAANRALKARMAEIRPLAVERLKDGGSGVEEQGVRGIQNRIRLLEAMEKANQSIYNAESAELMAINQDSTYIDAIQDEIAHADGAAKAIGGELETLKVELNAPSRVRQYEKADAPRREEDKRLATAGMAGLGTFGLFVLGMALLEFRSQRIGSIDDVSRSAGLRIVGTLPASRESSRRPVKRGSQEPSPYGGSLLVESIDSIRTMILHSTGDRPLRTIMIVSASSGEGKTSLACHLAMSLARSGMKTLLIDCDLRKPTIHRLFDVPASPGFSEFLRGEAGAAEVCRVTAVDGLDAIPAGACDSGTFRSLARAETGAIFDEFRGSHDIIVVDTSPILPVTDALLIGRHADAAVYSVLRDVSRLPWLHSAVGRLRLMNIRLLGVVVNGVRPPIYGTYYPGYGRRGDEADHG